MISDLCNEGVLTTERVEGIGSEQLRARPKDSRDRVGDIVVRFFFESLSRCGHFSGDPDPGTFLLQHDGRVAFSTSA